ncbi:MAG TPA: hypothetical protein VK162_02805 [Streptosporangiaceae bacterium]|nr:hypothetical protein [Streptosporangiaceae bacterium]
MGMVITYLLYLLISVGITVFVGSALSRSGRTFLLDVFGGNESLAEAVNRLLVVGFYLLNLGFVTLTLRATGEISGARQAVQLLSVKIGEMLLVIGALHFANLALFTRLRRRSQQQPFPPAGRVQQQPFPPTGRVQRQPLAAGSRSKGLQ